MDDERTAGRTCDADDGRGGGVVSSLDLPVDISAWTGEQKLILLKPNTSFTWCQKQHLSPRRSGNFTASIKQQQQQQLKPYLEKIIWTKRYVP